MSGKIVFLVGLVGVGGYVGHRMTNFDETLFPYSREQVETMLTQAHYTQIRKDGSEGPKVWAAGRNANGVTLHMQYSSSGRVIDCMAVISEVSPTETRVVPDCTGGAAPSSSAIARTEEELQNPYFGEHIQAALNQRAYNWNKVEAKLIGTVMRNMPAMQRDALRQADEMQQLEAGMKP